MCPYCFGLKQADEDDDSEGMDDDAMFRMDAYLAAMFNEKRTSGNDSAAQSQFLSFRFRVLSLLEIYLHKNPGNSSSVFLLSIWPFAELILSGPNMPFIFCLIKWNID